MDFLNEWFGTLRTIEGTLWLTLGISLGFLNVVGLIPFITFAMIGVGGYKLFTKDK
jgi:hypothetical protein